MNNWGAFRPSLKAVQLIAQIEHFQGSWEKNRRLLLALIRSLTQTTIITSSGASTRIEGALLTDEQVEELIEKGLKLDSVASRSEREVAGYVKSLTYIYEHSDHLLLSEMLIRELHQLLTEDLHEDELPQKQRGTYKDIANDVVERDVVTGKEILWLYTTPPGPQTQSAMTSLVDAFHNTADLHPLFKIAMFNVVFLAIHPFRDGNGRLSRLLTVLLLLQHYPWTRFVSHEKFIEDNKDRYYLALKQTQKTLLSTDQDFDFWIEFFLTIVLSQTKFLEQKINLNNQAPPKYKLNKNEQAVLDYLAKNGPSASSVINKKVKLSDAGIKKLLKRLENHQLVKKLGQGPATVYQDHSH